MYASLADRTVDVCEDVHVGAARRRAKFVFVVGRPRRSPCLRLNLREEGDVRLRLTVTGVDAGSFPCVQVAHILSEPARGFSVLAIGGV